MESSDSKDATQSVRVAVNIRPLLTPELLLGCTDCITVVPAEKQVQIGSHAFTFDYLFGGAGCPASRIFDECVATLVESLFQGYNGTVLAYGQTGSGKTYTMGTNYNGDDNSEGVIPRVMETIFSRVNGMKDSTEFLIRISFIEIFKEEVFDLLDQNATASCKGEGAPLARVAAHTRAPIHIRETPSGGIALAGVTEAEVKTKEEMASYLLRGAVSRATASTNMNSQSSRSHAIFTIYMEQKRIGPAALDDVSGDILCAKLHLVDLAGSERAKRTGADGTRLQEGIHINKGLLALGNVISALGDDKKRKECAHIPYRDSKLTRLLQDSLGGNSKTIMIACVSPADTNAEETLNTLKYANRARNIQNKAVVNRDPAASQMQRMKSEIQQLRDELRCLRGDSNVPSEELQVLNAALQKELLECRASCELLRKQAIDTQVERDMLMIKLEQARHCKQLDNADPNLEQNFDIMKKYVSKIHELEGELHHLRRLNNSRRNVSVDYLVLDDDESTPNGSADTESEFDPRISELNSGVEVEEKELEHSSLQEKLDRELKELDKKLEQKEAEMKRFADVDTSVLKQHYEKKVNELEQEKRSLQKEIEKLQHILANLSSNSDDSAQKLKEEYLQKLNFLETQVAELKKKQDTQSQILRQKQKSDEAAKHLQNEIQRIKAQKVQLQQTIKQESEQFRLWKASREKEVLQLKKEGRRNEYEMHKLLAFNQRQKMVLQRKTEEAANATRRLKELLESRKRTREVSGTSNGNVHGSQALMQAIEHELEVTVRVHEVRSEYERQMKERKKMAKELEELKQANISDSLHQTMSPGAITSRIRALENMIATSSNALISMGAHLSDAEESGQRERAFSIRERLSHVKSVAESRVIMNFLYDLVSSSRCRLRDREVDCIEKDSEIRDLKKKVVNLVGQLELQKTEIIRLENLMSKRTVDNSELCKPSGTGKSHIYDLRPKGGRSSFVSHVGGPSEEDDMDTSDSEKDYSDDEYVPPRSDAVAVPCCSCGSKSSCKTRRWCECRAAGRQCVVSCGAHRCSNKEEHGQCSEEMLPPPPSSSSTNQMDGDGESEKKNDSSDLVSHGAMLLQTAFSDKSLEPKLEEVPPPATSLDFSRRKPLSDIGNTVVKPNAPKPPRKTWRKSVRKSVIQLVPVEGPQTSEPSTKPDATAVENAATPLPPTLKLPRAISSTLSDNKVLKERNAGDSSSLYHHRTGGGEDKENK
ncbi:unnamed protein product [Cuscuta campestris]|uniref:Kinesin motor domain-containing protein n=1 Tax=Cuscuta campestris TaxID=132261 RepID=A0A484LD57_9ASTE|nr:unnamed protein product [Cuscuta campestris]